MSRTHHVCVFGLDHCGTSPRYSYGTGTWLPLKDDPTHKECNNNSDELFYHAWCRPNRTGRLWVCCGCSDMLREYGTVPFLIEELPV